MHPRRWLPYHLAVALAVLPLAAQQQDLVADIHRGQTVESASNPSDFTGFGGDVYFSAERPDLRGRELFQLGRTSGEVTLVGPAGGNGVFTGVASAPQWLSPARSQMFFRAQAATGLHIIFSEPRLYRTDGTLAGTRGLGYFQSVGEVATLGDLALFSAADYYVFDPELWVSDGTFTGTKELADIWAGGSSSPQHFVEHNGTLLFSARTGASRYALWRTDGTAAGTFELAAFAFRPLPFATAGGLAYLVGIGTAPGSQPGLWRTNGTPQGTLEVLTPFTDIQRDRGKHVPLGNLLLFVADDGSTGEEVWRTDGTAAGTRVVRNIAPGGATAAPSGLARLGSQVVFVAKDPAGGRSLYRTDGTTAGTVLLAVPGLGVCGDGVAAGGRYLFPGADAAGGCELWQSDGTGAGTSRVADLAPGPTGAAPDGLRAIGAEVFFSADDGTRGREPWRSDGTAQGTRLVDNMGLRNAGSDPQDLVDFYGATLFSADDGIAGRELWRSDGTAQGTARIADLAIGSASSNPTGLHVAQDRVLFAADAGTGTRLWRTDGTAAGTQVVAAVRPLPTPGWATTPTTTFFVGDDGATGTELWRTDGTAAGTAQVADLTPGAGDSDLRLLGVVGDRAVFRFAVSTTRTELWSSDGSAAGTAALALTVAWAPSALLGGTLYFTGVNGANGTELWRSDGTLGGTRLLADVFPGAGSSFPDQFAVAGDQLFFQANGQGIGVELWKTDGSAAGTVLVRDLQPGPLGGFPFNITGVGDHVVFRALGGDQLWRSDGTAAGTAMVFAFGRGEIAELTPVGSRRVVFRGDMITAANYTTHKGKEPWSIEPGTSSTQLVADIAAASASSVPRGFVLSGGRVLFGADDGTRGRELWSFHPGATVQPVGQSCSATPGFTLRSDDPVLGTSMVVRGRGAASGTTGALLLGTPAAPTQAAPGCRVYLATSGLTVLAPLAPAGSAFDLPLPLPAVPSLKGLRVGVQAVLGPTAAPLGGDLSHALWWTLQ